MDIVLVDEEVDPAVGVGDLGRPAQIVQLVGGRQVQATPRWRGPAGRQAAEGGGLRGVDIGDLLGQDAGDLVVGPVDDVTGLILGPDGLAEGVKDGDGTGGGIGAVLTGGDRGISLRDLRWLGGGTLEGVAVAGGEGAGAVGVHRLIG